MVAKFSNKGHKYDIKDQKFIQAVLFDSMKNQHLESDLGKIDRLIRKTNCYDGLAVETEEPMSEYVRLMGVVVLARYRVNWRI